jgi:DNA-binding ferritin-like protein
LREIDPTNEKLAAAANQQADETIHSDMADKAAERIKAMGSERSVEDISDLLYISSAKEEQDRINRMQARADAKRDLNMSPERILQLIALGKLKIKQKNQEIAQKRQNITDLKGKLPAAPTPV